MIYHRIQFSLLGMVEITHKIAFQIMRTEAVHENKMLLLRITSKRLAIK